MENVNVKKWGKQYEKYIKLVNKQLEYAKHQAQRIPELEKISNMSYEDWCEWQNKN